jgi:hypothetical protein
MAGVNHSLRKRCLAALARAQKSRDRVNAENTGNALERVGAWYHGIMNCRCIIENRNVK